MKHLPTHQLQTHCVRLEEFTNGLEDSKRSQKLDPREQTRHVTLRPRRGCW